MSRDLVLLSVTAACVTWSDCHVISCVTTWSVCVACDVLGRSAALVSTCMMSTLVVDRYLTVVRLHRVQPVSARTLLAVAALVTLSVLASLPWYLLVVVRRGSTTWSRGHTEVTLACHRDRSATRVTGHTEKPKTW